MRTCILGGGLAGALLAWRLAQATTGWHIDLAIGNLTPGCPALGNPLPGGRRRPDATATSGGAVRAYEPDRQQQRLATASLAELLASRTLRQWADYRPARSVCLRRCADGIDAAIADIELLLPGSAELAGATDLAREGWAGVHPGGVAVTERLAGYTSPGRWRDAVLADIGHRVAVIHAAGTAITPRGNGAISCTIADGTREYDIVIVATGAWTGGLLRASGLPADGYRTKSIQYAVHSVSGWRPPQFVDEVTGLYGRPTVDGGLLLGLPTELWDADPDRPPSTPALLDEAAALAAARFPLLRLGPVTERVGSTDCYAERPVLSLRPVLDTDHRLFTFSGGAGGAVKTVLAASQRAAIQLAEPSQSSELTSARCREGQQ